MSTTNLEIVVLDVNDNPPEFSSKAYFASVEEGAGSGADVVRVLATSRDSIQLNFNRMFNRVFNRVHYTH